MALPHLIKALPTREPVIRLFLLEGVKRLGKRSDKALVSALRKSVQKDGQQKPKFLGADLATADAIALAVVLRRK